MKSVITVELSVFERITPLVSGYLQSYALADPGVRSEYCFDTYTTSVKTPLETITRDLLRADADIYAFSSYIWNMGLVRSVVKVLREQNPEAQVILGGPQVMHHGRKYLEPDDENVTICNGEGEATFTEYLRELAEPQPELAGVAGISFYRGHQLINTDGRARIKDLNSIPSPFLSGLIKPDYSIGIIETNRGCPYHCGFCYWGAATNDRVYQFDEDRVRDEFAWMARSGNLSFYIADANWGMLSRDVTLSEHIAQCARQHGTPKIIYFSAAKNKPHAVTKITEIFQEAGLVTSQPVSMQTLEPDSLRIIRRENIKLEAFRAVQNDLQQRGLNSFIELIWPLPGETLESFKKGIGTLCKQDAQTVISYSHLLLNNTPLYHSQKALGLVTRPAGGSVAEAQVVVATEQVTEQEFGEGMRYFYAVHAVQNTRSLRAVSKYLTSSGITTYPDLFSSFVDFWSTLGRGDPITDFVEKSIRDALYYDVGNYGLHIHNVLHEHRKVFTRQLSEFVSSQPWWTDPKVRVLFEFDLLSRPYIYSNTPLEDHRNQLEQVCLIDSESRRYTVAVPSAWHESLAEAFKMELAGSAGDRFQVDHKRLQYPYMATQGIEHNANYCFGMIEKVQNIVPVWRTGTTQ